MLYSHNFVFFALKSIGLVSSSNIFVQVQYLIIFGFQKDLEFFDLFSNYYFFYTYKVRAYPKAKSPN
jgi:hypothetical protein